MKKIWLVRHAESKAQTQEELSIDANLSKFGIRQARQLGRVLRNVEFDKIFVSPLKRARQTFEYANVAVNCNVFFDTRLLEIMPEDSYRALLPYEELPSYGVADRHDAWLRDPFERAEEFLEELYNIHADNILVMAHAGTLSNILNIFLAGSHGSISDPNYKWCVMNNTAVSVLELDSSDGLDRLLIWNWQQHLDELGSSLMKTLANYW